MVDTPTSRNRIRKQEVGTNVNSWGTYLDEALDVIDQIIDGVKSIALTSSADYTLTTTNYSTADEAKNRVLVFSGALTGAVNVIIPSVEHKYYIVNDCGATLTLKTAAGAGVAIPDGFECGVYCDAVNVEARALFINGALSIAGQIKNVTAATLGTDAVNKTQMDAAIALVTTSSTPGTLRVTSSDTTSKFLRSALTTQTGTLTTTQVAGLVSVQLSTLNPSADEQVALLVGAGYVESFLPGALQAAQFTPVVGTAYPVNCTAADVTINLGGMASPQIGQKIKITAYGAYAPYLLGSVSVDGLSVTNYRLAPGAKETLELTANGWA